MIPQGSTIISFSMADNPPSRDSKGLQISFDLTHVSVITRTNRALYAPHAISSQGEILSSFHRISGPSPSLSLGFIHPPIQITQLSSIPFSRQGGSDNRRIIFLLLRFPDFNDYNSSRDIYDLPSESISYLERRQGTCPTKVGGSAPRRLHFPVESGG